MELHNIMENIVDEHIASVMSTIGCCRCERCVIDVKAISLNNLPPKYVATEMGSVLAKADTMSAQYYANVISAISAAAAKVKATPKHSGR